MNLLALVCARDPSDHYRGPAVSLALVGALSDSLSLFALEPPFAAQAVAGCIARAEDGARGLQGAPLIAS